MDDDSGAEERDLDDDIPDADDEMNNWIDEDGDDVLPVDEGEGDYADVDGLGEEGELEERDLDDDVPEAGSYQHTDTDVEDDSSEHESGRRRSMIWPGMGGLSGNPLMGGSVFGSSPVQIGGGRRSAVHLVRERAREN